jgi:phage portal protein BeeE
MQDYRVSSGGRRPVILDGDMKLSNLGSSSFHELDFNNSISAHESKILKAIGVPDLLINGGNNANINPNIRMFYIMTVLPLVNKVLSGFERFFGYDLAPAVAEVQGLRPDLNEQADYLTKLANSGIISRNEAREQIRLSPSQEDFAGRLILPANIAGSAIPGAGQSEGEGAPKQ